MSVLEQSDSAGDLGSKAAWKSHTLMALGGGEGGGRGERQSRACKTQHNSIGGTK